MKTQTIQKEITSKRDSEWNFEDGEHLSLSILVTGICTAAIFTLGMLLVT